MSAGKYRTRFTWMKWNREKDTTYKQPQVDHIENGNLWGSVEDLSADVMTFNSLRESTVNCEVRIRNYPAIDVKDRLRTDIATYYIEGIREGDNELILDCTRKREITR